MQPFGTEFSQQNIEKRELSKTRISTLFHQFDFKRIDPRAIRDLQNRSEAPPGPPRDLPVAARDPSTLPGPPQTPQRSAQTPQKSLNSCSGRYVDNNISSEIDIEANIGTYLSCWVPTELQFWPGGMRAAFKSAVSNGYMASMKEYVRPPVPPGRFTSPYPSAGFAHAAGLTLRLLLEPNDCFWSAPDASIYNSGKPENHRFCYYTSARAI